MSLRATLGSWEHVLATNQGTIDLQNRAKDVLGAFQQRSKVSSLFLFDALLAGKVHRCRLGKMGSSARLKARKSKSEASRASVRD